MRARACEWQWVYFLIHSTSTRLATRLLQITALSDDERKQLAEVSYAIAANFAPDRFGEGLEQAAKMAMNLKQRKIGLTGRALLRAAARYGR